MIAITLGCYFAKGVYSKVEKIITLCILGMIICFLATLISCSLILAVVLISGAILLIRAIVLHPTGQGITAR